MFSSGEALSLGFGEATWATPRASSKFSPSAPWKDNQKCKILEEALSTFQLNLTKVALRFTFDFLKNFRKP
jgi:hypothetical protein